MIRGPGQLIAGIMACALVIGNVSLTTAKGIELDRDGNNTMTGQGTMEGFIEKDVMRVVLPTADLNFKLDPEGLIYSAKPPGYNDYDFKIDGVSKKDGFVFFKKISGTSVKYSSSVDLKISNKSSFPVNVKVSASFDPGSSGITQSNSNVFSEKSPQIYFYLSEGSVKKSVGTNAVFEKNLNAASGNYSVVYTNNAYRYKYNESASDSTVSSYTVRLTGECSPYSEWNQTDPTKSKVSVVWDISRSDDSLLSMPSVKEANISIDSQHTNEVKLSVDYGGLENVRVSSLMFGADEDNLKSINSYTLDNNILKISDTSFKELKPGAYIYRIIFSNGVFDTVRIDVK